MTLAQLKEAVALLGFEQELAAIDETAERHFLYAAERALWQLARLRPATETIEVVCDPPQNKLGVTAVRHKGGETLVLTGEDVRGYTFRADGTGACRIEADGATVRQVTWNDAKNTRFCGLAAGRRVTLVFEGAYDYTVSQLALWDRVSSPRASDMEEGDEAYTYDPCQKISDFWKISRTQPSPFPDGVSVEDERRLRIPRSFRGRFFVRCDRRPPDLPGGAETVEIEEEQAQILPLLVAAELCLDDDADKSAYYLQQFRTAYTALSRTARNAAPVAWRSSNNW